MPLDFLAQAVPSVDKVPGPFLSVLLELAWVVQCDLTHSRPSLLGLCPAGLEAELPGSFSDLLAGCWTQVQVGTEGAVLKGADERTPPTAAPSSASLPGSAQLQVLTPDLRLGPRALLGFGSQETFSFWPSWRFSLMTTQGAASGQPS